MNPTRIIIARIILALLTFILFLALNNDWHTVAWATWFASGLIAYFTYTCDKISKYELGDFFLMGITSATGFIALGAIALRSLTNAKYREPIRPA